MKKRFLFRFCVLFIFVSAIIQYSRPDFIFNGDVFWDTCKSITLAFTVSLTVSSIILLLSKKDKVAAVITETYEFRYLLRQLVKRDFKAKYKRSVLGVLWSIINPLATMIIMTVVFSTLFKTQIENYPVYILSGNIIFTLFNESTNMCMSSIIASASLTKKVRVPKFIFLFSKILSSLINFVFSFAAFVIVLLFTKAPVHLSLLGAFLPVFYVSVFAFGVGLILATLFVFFRDTMYLYGIFMTALTYLTPLFYPESIIPEKFQILLSINPMYHFVECFRTVTLYGGMPSFWQNIACLTWMMLSLIAGIYIFSKKQNEFILYI